MCEQLVNISVTKLRVYSLYIFTTCFGSLWSSSGKLFTLTLYFAATHPEASSTTRSTYKRKENITMQNNTHVPSRIRNSKNQHKFTHEKTISTTLKTILFSNTAYKN
jgi:hypothetical protein